jgi:hypothetical protein
MSSNVKLTEIDPYLKPYGDIVLRRVVKAEKKRKELLGNVNEDLSEFARGHYYFGCFRKN